MALNLKLYIWKVVDTDSKLYKALNYFVFKLLKKTDSDLVIWICKKLDYITFKMFIKFKTS